jgi:hypothetical protein
VIAIRAALALIPRELLALALVAVLAWGAVIGHRLTLAQRDNARQAAAIATERAALAAAAASASEHARTIEAQRAADIAQAQEAHHARTQTLAADAAAARAAADRLRVSLDIAARTLRATGRAASDPGASSGGPSAGADPGMPAELLSRCVDRVRRLAEVADASRASGQLCERSYDALTKP